MIKIKCLNKKQGIFKYAGKENCTNNFQPFSSLFIFYKQKKKKKKIEVQGFSKTFHPIFFLFAYFS